MGGGGLLTAVHQNLEPVSINEDHEHEILVVEAKLGKYKVRFLNAYGPQEIECGEERERIKGFYNQLDLNIKDALMSGSLTTRFKCQVRSRSNSW